MESSELFFSSSYLSHQTNMVRTRPYNKEQRRAKRIEHRRKVRRENHFGELKFVLSNGRSFRRTFALKLGRGPILS